MAGDIGHPDLCLWGNVRPNFLLGIVLPTGLGRELDVIVGIMQPTYLPWLGYFDMMSRVDIFVLLDNVQFQKKSWQQRNRIRSPKGELLLTVPVRTSGRFEQEIREVEIDPSTGFARKHIRSIASNYQRAPYVDETLPQLAALIEKNSLPLSGFNEALIRFMAEILQVSTVIINASSLLASGKRTQLTVNQCLELGADQFLAAEGSRPYISKEKAFDKHGIVVEYHNFVHPNYPQLYGNFIPNLSAIDLILNCGRNAVRYAPWIDR